MKISTLVSPCLISFGLILSTNAAYADSAEATCEVRKDGDRQKGKSGACTVSQRQGYVDINLRNGDSVRLSPGGKSDHYKDQNGNKVVRISSGGSGETFKWENGKHIAITWVHGGGAAYSPGHSGGSEYQRGYDDGLRGDWDEDKHNQQYKDGYAAGEAARNSGHHGGNKHHQSGGSYGINRLDNGHFEVVWSQPFCSVLFNRKGEPQQYSDSCTSEQSRESYEIAQRER